MNKTKIEWCDSTWNPVTGCLHNCEYCYARGIANRFGGHTGIKIGVERKAINNTTHYPFLDLLPEVEKPMQVCTKDKSGKERYAPYPYGFTPTLHRYRLDEPTKNKKPQNIFVCSMADIFGEWVPDEWIREVFAACEKAPWHNYLFLTKNGSRYEQLGLLLDKDNYWYGTTRTGINRALECGASDNKNIFLSLEPLLAPIDNATLNAIELWNWVIIGCETGNRKSKVVPEKEWIDSIVKQCKEADVPVFMKDSLTKIMGEENMLREFPQGLAKEAGNG